MRFTQTVVFLCIATGNAIGVSSITTARWKNITFFHIRIDVIPLNLEIQLFTSMKLMLVLLMTWWIKQRG